MSHRKASAPSRLKAKDVDAAIGAKIAAVLVCDECAKSHIYGGGGFTCAMCQRQVCRHNAARKPVCGNCSRGKR